MQVFKKLFATLFEEGQWEHGLPGVVDLVVVIIVASAAFCGSLPKALTDALKLWTEGEVGRCLWALVGVALVGLVWALVVLAVARLSVWFAKGAHQPG